MLVANVGEEVTVEIDGHMVYDRRHDGSFDSGIPTFGLSSAGGSPGNKLEVRKLTVQRIDSLDQ